MPIAAPTPESPALKMGFHPVVVHRNSAAWSRLYTRRTTLTYATASDVAVRFGRELTAEEVSLVEIRLDDVERRILRRVPDLADNIWPHSGRRSVS